MGAALLALLATLSSQLSGPGGLPFPLLRVDVGLITHASTREPSQGLSSPSGLVGLSSTDMGGSNKLS
jgi:hypothetical protein